MSGFSTPPAARATSFILPKEFVELCAAHQVEPETVLKGFIADLCSLVSWAASPRPDGYSSNGSDERRLAREYYNRCGHARFWPAGS